MVKDEDLLFLAEELHKCGEIIIRLSEKLKPDMKVSYEKPEEDQTSEKELKLEDVRAVLAEKSRNGFTKEIKEILNSYGVQKLSEVEPKKYKNLLKEVEVLSDAK